MAKPKLTFEDVCYYAELCGCEHREEPSKAKDYTGQFFKSPWANKTVMVLYEAPRRTLRGHDKPEVCWWVIDSFGIMENVPARHIRMMTPARGLSIADVGYEKIFKILNKIQEDQ